MDEELFSEILASSTLDAIKFALTSSRDALLDQALSQLKLVILNRVLQLHNGLVASRRACCGLLAAE